MHAQARFNWSAAYGIGDIDERRPRRQRRAATAPAAGRRGVRAPLPARAAGLRYLQTGDAQMEAALAKVRRVIDRDIPILLLGETGTGKELLARAIHHDSSRARHPFVAVNCASIPETLIEAELFGYEEGAFTGARRKGAPGKIVQANGGTLFLDEIGDMPLALQARLLRVVAGAHRLAARQQQDGDGRCRDRRRDAPQPARDDRAATSSAKTSTTGSTDWW